MLLQTKLSRASFQLGGKHEQLRQGQGIHLSDGCIPQCIKCTGVHIPDRFVWLDSGLVRHVRLDEAHRRYVVLQNRTCGGCGRPRLLHVHRDEQSASIRRYGLPYQQHQRLWPELRLPHVRHEHRQTRGAQQRRWQAVDVRMDEDGHTGRRLEH